jgi:hypothetical protein
VFQPARRTRITLLRAQGRKNASRWQKVSGSVIPLTLAPRETGLFSAPEGIQGRRVMGNFGKRTALIFVVTLMLMGIGWDVALTRLADTPRVHCTIHSSVATCTSET